jgi:stearoyl-CoA desaturase (delta-9 desaturase)
VVDFDTLQAVITNRYDVLSQLRAVAEAGVSRGTRHAAGQQRFKGLKPGWRNMPATSRRNNAAARIAARREPCAANAYAMRQELVAVWERSNASREHLLKALQDWCERAENSGVRQLQELSLRLRSYVLA